MLGKLHLRWDVEKEEDESELTGMAELTVSFGG